MNEIIERTKELSKEVDALHFSFEGYVYNPLSYAWDNHELFLRNYVLDSAKVLFLGMNPGPFGMLQTGVPFGEVNAVKNWMHLDGKVNTPEVFHPGRPILGLSCPRSEVSGRRFWGLMEAKFKTPLAFFQDHCVFNYCPLGFLMNTKTAKNLTPDHLPPLERTALERVCDSYLSDVLHLLMPKALVGVGKYAEKKLSQTNTNSNVQVLSIIHPSPGNPQANNDWAGKTEAKLREVGLWK